MIVSHRHKLIFMHSRKTAGSSVSVSLLRYLDSDDWWLSAPAYGIMNDTLRQGRAPAPVITSYMLGLISEAGGAETAERLVSDPAALTRDERMLIAREYNAMQPEPPSSSGWQHVTAADARAFLGEEIWDSYTKISFERNPWDRMISLYWWRVRKERNNPPFTFRAFVTAMYSDDDQMIRRYRAHLHSNWEIYTIDDQLAVDHLGRYESLTEDLTRMLDDVGIEFDGWLPSSKSKLRKPHVDLYDDKTIKVVGEIFHREIDLLSYKPPR